MRMTKEKDRRDTHLQLLRHEAAALARALYRWID